MNDSRDAIRIIKVWVENTITDAKKPITFSVLHKGKKLDEDCIYRIKPIKDISDSNWNQISEIEIQQEIEKVEIFYVEQRLIFKSEIDIEPKNETTKEYHDYDLKIKLFFSLNPFLKHWDYSIEEMDAKEL